MSRPRPLLVTLAVLMLAACGTSSYRNYISPVYTGSTFNYAAGGRDLKVEVYGNPSNLDQQSFAQAVVDAMQGHNPGQPTHLTLFPGPSARPLYRVVIAFDPARPVNVSDLCQGPVETAQTTAKTQIRASLCQGGGALTSVRGEMPAGTTPDSPEFQSLMAAVARQLMPRENPDDPRDGGFCRFVAAC